MPLSLYFLKSFLEISYTLEIKLKLKLINCSHIKPIAATNCYKQNIKYIVTFYNILYEKHNSHFLFIFFLATTNDVTYII